MSKTFHFELTEEEATMVRNALNCAREHFENLSEKYHKPSLKDRAAQYGKFYIKFGDMMYPEHN